MRTESGALTEAEWTSFRRLVDERSGIHLPSGRRIHLEQAVARALAKGDHQDISSLYRHLSSQAGHTDLEDFVASLTVGETHFFRNKPQIAALEDHVLPDLIRRRSTEKRLRIWSAGCSTGEEAYSVAMLLDRILPDLGAWNITILATDIDRDALKKARLAIYRPWSFRGVAEDLWSRYFSPRDDALELIPQVREMVRFEYLNLVEDAYPSLLSNTNAMDLIICRNVLIYFREETARSVVERLQRSMAEDAWLFLGHAEPSYWVGEGLSLHNFPGTIAFRGSRERSPSKPHRIAPPPRPVVRERRTAPRAAKDRRRARAAAPEAPSAEPNAAPAPVDRCDSALGLLATGDAGAALAELEVLTKDHPQDPRPPYLVAKVYAGALEVERAEIWTRVALERDRLFAPAHYLQGLIAAEDGRLEEALGALRRCTYAAPRWALGHFVLAETLLRSGQRHRAIGALRNVESLLADAPADQEVQEGDGLTAGRLRELAEMQKAIFGLEGAEARQR